jgi:hypothetical protein
MKRSTTTYKEAKTREPRFGSQPIAPSADCFEAVRKHGLHFVMGSAVAVDCPEIETRTLARQLSFGEDLCIGFKLKLNEEF